VALVWPDISERQAITRVFRADRLAVCQAQIDRRRCQIHKASQGSAALAASSTGNVSSPIRRLAVRKHSNQQSSRPAANRYRNNCCFDELTAESNDPAYLTSELGIQLIMECRDETDECLDFRVKSF